MGLLFGIGIGAGLAAVAGLRASLPLAGMLSIVIFSGFGNPPLIFMQINSLLSLPVVCAPLALLLLECLLDKFAVLAAPLDRAMIPVRSISGAAVFALASVEWSLLDPMLGPMSSGHFVTLPSGIALMAPYLIAGALIAGVVAALKAASPRPFPEARIFARSRASRSLLEDAVALVGVVLPFLAILLVALLLTFLSRPPAREKGETCTPGRSSPYERAAAR